MRLSRGGRFFFAEHQTADGLIHKIRNDAVDGRLARLNGMMAGSSSFTTSPTGEPINSGVNTRLHTHITAVMASVPAARPSSAALRVRCARYKLPARSTNVPVARKCMMMPMGPAGRR